MSEAETTASAAQTPGATVEGRVLQGPKVAGDTVEDARKFAKTADLPDRPREHMATRDRYYRSGSPLPGNAIGKGRYPLRGSTNIWRNVGNAVKDANGKRNKTAAFFRSAGWATLGTLPTAPFSIASALTFGLGKGFEKLRKKLLGSSNIILKFFGLVAGFFEFAFKIISFITAIPSELWAKVGIAGQFRSLASNVPAIKNVRDRENVLATARGRAKALDQSVKELESSAKRLEAARQNQKRREVEHQSTVDRIATYGEQIKDIEESRKAVTAAAATARADPVTQKGVIRDLERQDAELLKEQLRLEEAKKKAEEQVEGARKRATTTAVEVGARQSEHAAVKGAAERAAARLETDKRQLQAFAGVNMRAGQDPKSLSKKKPEVAAHRPVTPGTV